MVFEEIIRHSPRRRALPWIAEGFSPTASAPLGYQLSAIAYRLFIQPDGQRSSRLSAISYRLSAIHSARRHAAHTGLDSQSPSARRPALRSAISYQLSPIGYSFSPTARGAYRIIAILRYIDPCPGLPCRARRPLPATGAVQSNRPCERCAPISAPSRLRVSRSDAHRDAEHAERCRTRRLLSMACSTLFNKTNLCENCYTCSIFISPAARTDHLRSVAASAADCPATYTDSSGFPGRRKIVLTRGGDICGAIWGQ
jgi:hypothetical protein